MLTDLDTETSIPDAWKWALVIFDEAHLLKIGLPARQANTQAKYAKVTFDLLTNSAYNLGKNKFVKRSHNCIEFFYSN